MPFDVDRYQSLISRCAFDMSAYKGTYQDQSKNRLAMSAVGTPGWTQVNGLPALTQVAAADGATSAAVASVVDTTSQFYAEVLCSPGITAIGYILYQVLNGGWYLYIDPAGQRAYISTRTNTGAAARYAGTAAGTILPQRLIHLVMRIDVIGLTAGAWINSVPAAVTFTNAGVPAICDATQLLCLRNGDRHRLMIARVWQGTPTNADVTCLYQAAKSLVGEV